MYERMYYGMYYQLTACHRRMIGVISDVVSWWSGSILSPRTVNVTKEFSLAAKQSLRSCRAGGEDVRPHHNRSLITEAQHSLV